MTAWSSYNARFGAPAAAGSLRRHSAHSHIQDRMRRRLTASLSYQEAFVGHEPISLAVLDSSDDFETKRIFSLPGESLPHGSLVDWADSKWLVTEVNTLDELCTEGKMRRCNYYLRWIDDTGFIIGRWCVVEDGTKYLIGERQREMMTIGDARIAITIGKDSDTNKLGRGRRFLVDDVDSDADSVLAYELTKPNKLFNVYNGKGVFRFILTEVNRTDNDNVELRIADYYSWEPDSIQYKPDTYTDDVFETIAANSKERKQRIPEQIQESGVWL